MFEKATALFESKCKEFKHSRCEVCHSVSMNMKTKLISGIQVCMKCKAVDGHRNKHAVSLPTWVDLNGIEQYLLPNELVGLREGEKLLLQRVSVYVPLLHLQYGQVGIRGHVCCFPQDTSEVCNVLPRLPSQVTIVKVIRSYNLQSTDSNGVASMIWVHVAFSFVKKKSWQLFAG